MRSLSVIPVIVALLLSVLSCSEYTSPFYDTLTVFTWNVQNLFDDVDDGTEYSEYSSKGGWTSSMYRTKLDRVVSVLGTDILREADIAVLTEIENENVTDDLLRLCDRAGFSFEYYCFCRGENQSAGIAVLSRIPIKSSFIHGTGDSQRPVLEADFETSWGKLCVLAVHFKAKEKDAGYDDVRKNAASVVRAAALQRIEEGFDTVITAGDFNEQYSDFNTMGPDVSYIFPVTGNKYSLMWYSPWLDSLSGMKPDGSYMYNTQWQAIDNILVKNNTGLWNINDAGVVTDGITTLADGSPNAFNRKLLTGVSDHLPIWIRLI